MSVFFVEYYGYYFVCILRAVDPSLRAKNKEHTSSRDVCFVKTGRKMMRRAVQMHILNMLEGWASFKTNLYFYEMKLYLDCLKVKLNV